MLLVISFILSFFLFSPSCSTPQPLMTRWWSLQKMLMQSCQAFLKPFWRVCWRSLLWLQWMPPSNPSLERRPWLTRQSQAAPQPVWCTDLITISTKVGDCLFQLLVLPWIKILLFDIKFHHHSFPLFFFFSKFLHPADDCQQMFLHPVNVRCLLREYGSLEASPESITATVVEIVGHTVTEVSKQRNTKV